MMKVELPRLPFFSLLSLSEAFSRWNKLSRDENIWKNLYNSDFGATEADTTNWEGALSPSSLLFLEIELL